MQFSKLLTRVFGSRNDRLIKNYRKVVEQVNAIEPKVQPLTDSQLRERTTEIRNGIREGRLKLADVMHEALAIIRESMDRHIGIRSIFNPDEKFDPDQFDDALLEAYDEVQRRMIATGESWQKVTIPPKIYEAVRKIYPDSRPPFRARCFDVQIIGGLVLYEGKIAEMATGEGKTFVAPLACFLRVLEGMHCHVVTVNDYLVRRDSAWVRPAFENLGISVGFIQQDMEPGGAARKQAYECDITYGTNSEFGFDYLRDNMKERVDLQVQGPLDFVIVDEVDSILIDEARTPLIISGAAHDDAPKYRAADEVARKVIALHKPYADAEKACDAAKRKIKAAQGDYDKAKSKEEKEAAKSREAAAEKELEQAEAHKATVVQYYEVELDKKTVHLTHEGIAAAQDAAGVGSFFVGNNMEWPHLMEQSMRAHVVYERDRDYVVDRGQNGQMEVVIVDEFTGRKMVGRQWSDGLHQAIEAKERVPIKQETQTLATITLQNFFKLYQALAGMTGTAQTEAEEFMKIYRLEVVTIPTNRTKIRVDHDDRVYRSEREKWEALIEEIKLYSDAGRPVLVGTTSVERSEMLSQLLTRKYGIKHEVLNARYHEREASIIALAGQSHVNAHGERVGNVTIATNMAGRGTDIKLAPETVYEVTSTGEGAYQLKQRTTGKIVPVAGDSPLIGVFNLRPSSVVAGGLHVVGTERHTARRIDNQLRGRSGRQGDPGSSRFYISLQDELMKNFANEWTIKILGFLGMEEGMAIEDKRITKGILKAQRKVEERHFLGRKNLLEYDEVMDHQRTHFYGMRQRVLEGRGIDKIIWSMIGDSIEDAVTKYVEQDYVAATIAEWARQNFDVTIDAQDIKGMRKFQDLEEYIRNAARTDVETSLPSTLGEFMGEDAEDSSQWDTKQLQSWAMSKYQINVSQSQLRKMNAHDVEEMLKEAALAQIDKRDCAGILKYLEPNYAIGELCRWAMDKFGITIDPKELIADERRGLARPAEEIVALIEERAKAAYAPREYEYPVDHALVYAFGPEATQADNPYGADYIRAWAMAKFGKDLKLEEIRSKSIRTLRDVLIGLQQESMTSDFAEREVDQMLAKFGDDHVALLKTFNTRFFTKLTERDLRGERRSAKSTTKMRIEDESDQPAHDVRSILVESARAFLRRELTDLEQFVLIQIFDQTWKDHLYAMDMLKSSIGLHAFAERDPRVLYKKEGFRYFTEMMANIRDKVTDLIFRARIAGDTERRSAYRETAASAATDLTYGVSEPAAGDQPQAQASGGGAEAPKVKTITRDTAKVGRNDPCPCGSGKKYKKCCGAGVD